MNLMTQVIAFNAYTNVEAITPNAYTVYMKLLFLNNDLYWKEWFSITYNRIGAMANIHSSDTIANAINFLEQKGFIEVKHNGNKKPNQYKIVPLNDLKFRSKNEDETGNDLNFRSKSERKANVSRTKTPSINKQNKTETKQFKAAAAAENANENSNPKLGCCGNETKDSLTLAEDKEQTETLDEFAATVKMFQENFHATIGKIELEELHALFLRYGALWLKEAAQEAALSGGRSVRYIGAILERWEKDGFKTSKRPPKQGGRNVGEVSGNTHEPKIDGLEDFVQADKTQKYPWDV